MFYNVDKHKTGFGVVKMYFLIDYENVNSAGLAGSHELLPGDHLLLFYSQVTPNCEQGYLDAIEKSGCELEICKLVKKGKNALDFYIATRLGELYGSGCSEQAAIISKDNGFQALRDYWNKRLGTGHKLVLAASVEKAIALSAENSDRATRIRKGLTSTKIELFYAGYQERCKLRTRLEQLFHDTPYSEKIIDIQDLLEKNTGRKIIYLDSLKRFGKRNGLEIYRKLKEENALNVK